MARKQKTRRAESALDRREIIVFETCPEPGDPSFPRAARPSVPWSGLAVAALIYAVGLATSLASIRIGTKAPHSPWASWMSWVAIAAFVAALVAQAILWRKVKIAADRQDEIELAAFEAELARIRLQEQQELQELEARIERLESMRRAEAKAEADAEAKRMLSEATAARLRAKVERIQAEAIAPRNRLIPFLERIREYVANEPARAPGKGGA